MSNRGSIRRRGKNSWELKFDVPSSDGTRKTQYVTVRGRRQDAQRELTRLLGAADVGAYVEPDKISVGEHVRKWIEGADIGAKTRERYGELLKHQIAPHIGAVPLQHLKQTRIAEWHKTLLVRGGKGETPLAPRTVASAHRVLRAALGAAVKADMLHRNVASLVSAPKPENDEVEILEPAKVTALLAGLADHPFHVIANTALASGMRRGELLALAWSCVDLDAGTIRVERSLEDTKAGGLRFKPPKTKHGRRTISLPASAVAVLREHRRQQLELRLQLGQGKPEPDALVFCKPDGSPMRPDQFSWSWIYTCQSLNLPRVRFHSLRHLHASALIAAGIDVVQVSRRLGHANPTVTLNTYAHLFRQDERAAVAAIANVLG